MGDGRPHRTSCQHDNQDAMHCVVSGPRQVSKRVGQKCHLPKDRRVMAGGVMDLGDYAVERRYGRRHAGAVIRMILGGWRRGTRLEAHGDPGTLFRGIVSESRFTLSSAAKA